MSTAVLRGTDVVIPPEHFDGISKITNSGFCQKARSFAIDMRTPEKSENYVRTVIVKEAVKAALYYSERDPKAIMEYMSTRYEECMFQNYQQKRISLIWDFRRVMRYLNDETRIPSFMKEELVSLGGRTYNVKPDFCFVDGDHIEVVMLKIGKPDITKRGKQNAEIRDLRLYAMVLFGRALGYRHITASYYFLKKNSDTTNWMQCEQAFFGNGGNIVSMEDEYLGRPNQLDKQMERFIRMLDEGVPPEHMCDQDCERCDKKELCKYMDSPIRITKEPVVRSAKDVRLTQSQAEAINVDHGIYRINAGAGAGKTMVVAFHIKALLEKGVKPEEICCITFTNAGAKEMLHRAELYAGRDLEGMTIQTFNAFENDIVKDCWQMLGYAREPKVIDDIERFSIIANLLNRNPVYEWTGNSFLNFTSTNSRFRGALQITADVFSAVKKSGLLPGQVTVDDIRDVLSATDIPDSAAAKLISLYSLFDQELKQKGLIEFDDQEILTFKVLNELEPDYLENHYGFKHIVVDEFQDTSEGQIELVKRFRMLPTFESLMVIGDDSQAIFGFRNTSPEFIINFEKYIGEPVKDIMLMENHRSTPEIIDFANKINDMNVNKVNKQLIATRPHGAPVIVNGFYNKGDELDYIVNGIEDHLKSGFSPEDIAVIAYTKAELRQIADLLTKKNIPSMFAAPELLLDNSRIYAILAFVRVIRDTANRRDALIALNARMRGCLMSLPEGKIEEELAKLIEEARMIQASPVLSDKKRMLFDYIDSITAGDETVENFRESLKHKDFEEIVMYCEDFLRYGENAAYKRISDYPGVVLVTAHSSKGLEWPVIYNTITKYQKDAYMSNASVEEVRRLLFVSATRARDELYITGLYASGSSIMTGRTENRFLQDAHTAVGKEYTPIYD